MPIVRAVATAVGLHASQSDLSRAVQAAMTQAVEQAIADGVSMDDVDEILRRKDAARARVLEAAGA